MAKVSGKYGFISITTTSTPATVAGITQWSLDYTADMLETTDFSASGVASYIPGPVRWSGSFSGYKDGAPQGLGTANTVSLSLAEASVSTSAWHGKAYISGIHPTTNFDGIVGYAYDFQGTGTVSSPTA